MEIFEKFGAKVLKGQKELWADDNRAVTNFAELYEGVKKDSNLTNIQVSEICGVSASQVSKWKNPEKHGVRPKVYQVHSLQQFTELPIEANGEPIIQDRAGPGLDAVVAVAILLLIAVVYATTAPAVHEVTGSWNPFSLYDNDRIKVTIETLP